MTDTAASTTAPQKLGEVASARRDITVPVFGGLMRPQDDVLLSRGGGKGLRIYDEIERDAHAYAVLQKRKLAVIARDWTVKPGGVKRLDRQAADLVEAVLSGKWSFNFDLACYGLLDALLKGFAVGEVMWQVRDGFIVPVEVKARDQRRFVFDEDAKLRLLTWENMATGEELPDRKFITHRFGDKNGDPYGLGLGHKLFWPVWFKRQNVSFWLVFGEKFGSPTVVGEVPAGVDEDEVLDKLAGIAQETALVVPEGTIVKFLEAMRSGAGDFYERKARYWDEQVSEATLGETLSTNISGGGSRAASETHNEVRAELTDADADLLTGALADTLIRWIVDLNYPGAAIPSVTRPRPEKEEEKSKAKKSKAEASSAMLKFVNDMRASGYEPENPNGSMEEQFAGGWKFVGKPPPPAPKPDVRPPPSFAEPARDGIDALADQLQTLAGAAMDAMIDEIRKLLDQSNDLAEVADKLLGLYPTLSAQALGEAMQGALIVADLTGRRDLIDGQ